MRDLVFQRYQIANIDDIDMTLPRQELPITVDGDPVVLHLLAGEVHTGFKSYSVEYRGHFLICYVDETVYVTPNEQLATQIIGGSISLGLRVDNESNSLNG